MFDICGMEELVEAAVDGYNVTIFAFGQTGSGKTHTMLGPRLARLTELSGPQDLPPIAQDTNSWGATATAAAAAPGGVQGSGLAGLMESLMEDDGVLARCVYQLYHCLEAREAEGGNSAWKVEASCCEIYNEAITDLLAQDKGRQLQVGGFGSLEPWLCGREDGKSHADHALPHRLFAALLEEIGHPR